MDFCDQKIIELKDNTLYNELLNAYRQAFNITDKECARSIAHAVNSYKDAFLGLGPRKYKKRVVMNYDFATNWYTKIVPLLTTEEMKDAIREGCTLLCAREFDVPPASHCSSDAYSTLSMEMQCEFLNNLTAENVPEDLKEDYARYLELSKKQDEEEDDDPEYYEIQEKMFDKHFDWKTHLSSYVIIGACHEWNSTFGFQLAKLVEPDEDWYVKKGPNHTTVINRVHTKCFDITMWGVKYLHHYCRGEKFPVDPTLGGTDAYEFAFGIGDETVEVFARSLQCTLAYYKLIPIKEHSWDTESYNKVVKPILKKYVNTIES